MQTVGEVIDGTPEAWAAVAMACLDQGMLSCSVQDRITAVLRAAGVNPEASS